MPIFGFVIPQDVKAFGMIPRVAKLAIQRRRRRIHLRHRKGFEIQIYQNTKKGTEASSGFMRVAIAKDALIVSDASNRRISRNTINGSTSTGVATNSKLKPEST